MQIRIVNVGSPVTQGKLVKLPVKYEADGQEKERTLVSIGKTKDVIDTLKKASKGSLFDIKLEKDGQYWNWVSATGVESSQENGSTQQKGASNSQSTSRFETPEERAFRQELIVRQNSVTNAVAYYAMANLKTKPTPQEVVGIARIFEDYVFGREIEELRVEGDMGNGGDDGDEPSD